MIIFGFIGSTLLIFNDLSIRIIGWVLLLFAYFFDMLDGKTSRMLNTPLREEINYLDNNFHVPITAYTLFIISIRVYLNTNNPLFLGTSFFLPWIFIWKGLQQHSFEYHYLSLTKPQDVKLYQEQQSKTFYHNYMYETKGAKHFLYVCARPFIDATDIWFALLPVMIIHLDAYFIIILIIIHALLLLFKFNKHTKLLNPNYGTIIENWHRSKKKSYEDKVMLNKDSAFQDLVTINDILESHKMKCWLYGGTLLGAVRNCDFIKGDGDIDLGYVGKSDDFKNIIKEIESKGFVIDIKYNHIKIISPNCRSKIDISVLGEDTTHYIEDVLKINKIGEITDAIIWMLQYPAEYKYESVLPKQFLQLFTSFLQSLPFRDKILKISVSLYKSLGYITTEFRVEKDFIEPLKKIKFRSETMYCPNKEDKLFELFYGKEWRIPSEDYIGRKLKIIPNR